jgi:hypothetical protein
MEDMQTMVKKIITKITNLESRLSSVDVKPMRKNERMKKLIEYLAELESSDWQRMSEDGRMYIGKIWNLLGMPSQEEINKPKAKNEQ